MFRPPRREFLLRASAIGASIGASTVFDALAQTPDLGRPLDIVIVGAGLSGLCAAYELEKRGHRITMLEADAKHIGGRTRTLRFGDGTKGWAEQAPFDRIIVTAAAPELPAVLSDSLAVGGVLVAPVGDNRRDQQLLRIRRQESGFATEELGAVRFVPLVAGLPRDGSGVPA